MFALFVICTTSYINPLQSEDTPPVIVPDRTPGPTRSPSPSRSRVNKKIAGGDSSQGVEPWLIACTAIICIIIIVTLVVTIILCFRHNKGEIYAHDTMEDQHLEAGAVEVKSIYRTT